MGAPEAKVENYLSAQCRRRGWLCWKLLPASIRGVPDRLVVAPHVTAFVECKSATGALRPQQRLRIRELEALGAPCFVPHTRSEVDELIASIEALSAAASPEEGE